MSTRSRRGMAPKAFVPGGIMTAQQRPLIVLPKQQQQQHHEQQQVQPSQQFHQQAQQQPQNQSQQQLQQQQQQLPQQQQQQQPSPLQNQQQPQLQGQNSTNSTIKMEQNPIPVIGSVSVSNAQHQAVQQPQLSENLFKNEMNDALSDDEMSRKSLFRKFLGNRKKASVRAKERRLRQNKRLRKVLVPKNALMALHELRGIKISEFNVMNKTGGGFVCQVTVNNIQYEGFGVSKMNAKSDACEKALRDLFISKMFQRPLSKNPSVEKLDATDSNADNKNNSVDEVMNNNDDIEMKSVDGSDEDDLPMINLASYALHKLFSEWENEGFEIPEFRSSSAASNAPPQGEVKKVPTIRSELPANWETMHPAMLLCMMRPGSSYTDLGTDGALPNQIQKVGITIDGEHFIGAGRSKKVARKDAAIHACNKLFGTNYTHDQ